MRVVALVAQKGGTGKSTIAAHLAVCAARRGQAVALIDLDPQASISAWGKRRTAGDVEVVTARPQELPRLLDQARDQGGDLVVVDTPGQLSVTSAATIALADLVLIPCRPAINDLAASELTAAQVRRAGPGRAAFVLNQVLSFGSRHVEAREALATWLPVCPVELHGLVAYQDALTDGRSVEELDPRGKAAAEIVRLYEWSAKEGAGK